MNVKFRKVIKEVEEAYYVASDGLEFDSEYKCREHENELAINQAKIDFDFKKIVKFNDSSDVLMIERWTSPW